MVIGKACNKSRVDIDALFSGSLFRASGRGGNKFRRGLLYIYASGFYFNGW